jgi:hypothetical protein
MNLYLWKVKRVKNQKQAMKKIILSISFAFYSLIGHTQEAEKPALVI